jgi:hypothetical protein
VTHAPGIVASIDRVRPAVAVTSPSDNDRIAGCQLYLDGSPLGGELTAPPYQQPVNTAALSSGGHSCYATTRDRVGNTFQAPTVTWNARDQHPPSGSIWSPGNGATVSDTINFACSVSDDVGVSYVQWNVDGAGWTGAFTNAPYYYYGYDTHNLGNGWHTIYLLITDTTGNQTQTSSSFYVNNQPPGGGYVSLGPFEYYGWEYVDYYPNFNPNGKAFHPGTGYMPGNPNPTYYAMQGQLWCADLGDSSWPGSTTYVGLWINANPDGGGNPHANVQIGSNGTNPSGWFGLNGGEYVRCERWSIAQDVVPTGEVRVNYRFVPRYAS